jgi:hypothetical protein
MAPPIAPERHDFIFKRHDFILMTVVTFPARPVWEKSRA